MNFNNMVSILNDVGSTQYDVYVPSLERDVKFRAITVGEQKTLSKTAINNENPIDSEKAILELFKKTCLETDINFNLLNELDKSYLLLNFYLNNYPSQQYSFKCEKCKENYSGDYDLDSLIGELNKLDCKHNKIYEREYNNAKYIFECNFNTIADNFNFYNSKEIKDEIARIKKIQEKMSNEKKKKYQDLAETEELDEEFINDIDDINITLSLKEITESFLKLCIRKIFIKRPNQEDITFEMEGLSIHERIKLIDLLPIDIINNSKEGILKFLIESFYTPLSNVGIKTTCTQCGAANIKNISVNDFFL